MNTIPVRGGGAIPVLGQGTWRMGEDRARRSDEVRALRLGLDLGMTLIDTAEMYGRGGAEEVVAEAIRGRRDEVFLVSKVLPENASYDGVRQAAEASLRRLETDRLDLYLLHWESSHPLEETLRAFAELSAQGKILAGGISNFDLDDTREALKVAGGEAIASNQVLYNLRRREAETGLIPFCRDREIVVMAYSPVEQGRLKASTALETVARRHDVSPECAAIAWSMREAGVVTIPKAVQPEHVRDNARAAELTFNEEDLELLDREFPIPGRDASLGVY